MKRLILAAALGTILGLASCQAVHTEADKLTGTTLAERCAFYATILEPIAAAVAAGAALTPEETILVNAFNALNCTAFAVPAKP